VRIGTRGSPLALRQAENLAAELRRVALQKTAEGVEIVSIASAGDECSTATLRELGQGAFTDAIDRAVADGRADVGVHSLKDAPIRLPPGVRLAACLPRGDPRDALISLTATSLGAPN
jgi:hydroxymethylbilane synthase